MNLFKKCIYFVQVSSIGIFQARISNILTKETINNKVDFPSVEMVTVVLVGQWMSDIVSILSWPYLVITLY